AEFELTPVQYAALVAVREHPGIYATRLSAVIAFDRSTIGDVLERLESKELIHRRPTPDDKRIKLLELTPQGRKLLAAIMPALDRAQARRSYQGTPASGRSSRRSECPRICVGTQQLFGPGRSAISFTIRSRAERSSTWWSPLTTTRNKPLPACP